jgi:hypothetical protein
MTNKDKMLLEEAYKKVLKEEISDVEMNTPTRDMNMSQERPRVERINSDEEDREEDNDQFEQIKIGLGRENASPKQADLLQGLDYNKAKDLLNHLNSIGGNNEGEYWVLKDNLILQLFNLLKNPNI